MREGLDRQQAALLLVDVQEKLLPAVERSCAVTHALRLLLQGIQLIDLPLIVSEQYPQGLGSTCPSLQACLPKKQQRIAKTSFSALGSQELKQAVAKSERTQWILVGIEAHVCVLQTARDLLQLGYQVVVLNDAISSRSIYDYSTAIGEMRDMGARISSVETVLFELMGDSQDPAFKALSALIQQQEAGTCAGC